jgi:hypothetical protein
MARNFLGVPAQAYIGNVVSYPFKKGGKNVGTLIPFTINWTAYGAGLITSGALTNFAVNVDYKLSLSIPAQWFPQSIYIDNTGSPSPIYCYFPDTKYVVVAQPNSEGWYPVLTNSLLMIVIAEGLEADNLPITNILLSDLFLPPNVNLELPNNLQSWLASPVITRGTSIYNTNFGVPALGDQTVTYFPEVTSASGTFVPNMWGTPYSSGFLYLTHVSINCVALDANTQLEFSVKSTGAAGTLWGFLAIGLNAGLINLISLSSMNIKLDATQTWEMSVVAGSTTGTWIVQSVFNYTVNPQ